MEYVKRNDSQIILAYDLQRLLSDYISDELLEIQVIDHSIKDKPAIKKQGEIESIIYEKNIMDESKPNKVILKIIVGGINENSKD